MMAYMNPWFLLAMLVALLSASGIGYWRGDKAGRAEIQQQWDHEKADLLAKHTEAVNQAREKEQNWQQAADNIRQEKDREIRNLNARTTALSNVMRQRQDRPSADASNTTQTTGSGQVAAGCTGKQLYRPDGEFLVGEAARADEIRAALKQCYSQYEAIRSQH
jgi:hypothetical protein